MWGGPAADGRSVGSAPGGSAWRCRPVVAGRAGSSSCGGRGTWRQRLRLRALLLAAILAACSSQTPTRHKCLAASGKCAVALTALVHYEAADQVELAAILPRTLASVAGFVENACVCTPACAHCGLPPAAVPGARLPTRMVTGTSPEACLAACVPRDGSSHGVLHYALPLLAGEILEVTVGGMEAAHAGAPPEQPQAAATVAATLARVLAEQKWPDAVMLIHAATLEAPPALQPALLHGGQAWELGATRAWRTPRRIVRGVRSFHLWPTFESVNFRVLTRSAAVELLDARAEEERLRGELDVAGGEGAERASLLYSLGRAQERLGKSVAASDTFDGVLELRGKGASDEHLYHAYVVTGRERAARGGLEQGLLRFLAAYEVLPERGVEALVEAAAACRQSSHSPHLSRLFALAAAAENQARLADGLPVPAGANAAAYDHLADVEAFVSTAKASARSALRAGLAAGARLVRNDAAPRFLWRVWKYNVVTVLDKLKLRADALALQPSLDDVIDALAPEVPRCNVEHVGDLGDDRGCAAMAGLLSPQLVIVEAPSRHAAAARLALSLGCASYWRVRVPARVMPVELRYESASGESGQQARKAFAHACALAHVASAFRGEALPVAVMQDDAPAPAPGQLPGVVRRLTTVVQAGDSSGRARITPLGGDSLGTSMHAYAVSAAAAEQIARLLSDFEDPGSQAAEALNTQLVSAPFHAMLEPLTLSGRLVIKSATGALPFAMQQQHGNSTGIAGAGVLVVACVGDFDAVAQACEQQWLLPMLLRNATGMHVRMVSKGDVAEAHVVLLLYSHGRAGALARARQLSRSVALVIAQTLQPSGSLDVVTAAGAISGVPLLPRWLRAALVLRRSSGALDDADFHPGLLAPQHADWLLRPAAAVHLWLQGDTTVHEAPLGRLFSSAGLALHVVGPVSQRQVEPVEKRAPRVVVSLTSIPPRIHFLPRVVAALLNQTCTPDVIYVTLPRVWARGGAADWEAAMVAMAHLLTRLDQRIVVLRPDEDLGPVMKLIPTLEAEEARSSGDEALILYLDDDWVLSPGFVAAFVAASARLPGRVIYKSCGDDIYDVARRDARAQRLGCSLPEAFQGVLLPLSALRVATDPKFVAAGLRGLVARAAAHPVCLRSDDYVLGEIYTRLGIRSVALPGDLDAGLGRTALTAGSGDDGDSHYALSTFDATFSSRYNSCAPHLRLLLDALLPLTPMPVLLPELHLPHAGANPLQDAFAAYRFAAVRDAEQTVLALTVGAVPVLLDCTARDTLEARVIAPSRVLCATGRSAGFALRRLALNATAQRAFFARPAVAPGARDAVQALLGDAVRVLRERALQLCAGEQPSGFAAVCVSLAALPDADKY